ncbi:N-6 DNA methylase [Streptosporangium sp. NPDC087985]|uniref:N-6 DNA methylase n=1 Tax=Streptosporangium sp. NPDC087985 TaxID=3366196 RepID=UPI00380D6C70
MQDSATVAAADIARLAGVGRAAVSNWRRRFDDFPSPVGGTSSSPLFSLSDVEDWLRRQGKLAEVPLDERIWQELRAGVEDLRLAEAIGQVGAFLLFLDRSPAEWARLAKKSDDAVTERLADELATDDLPGSVSTAVAVPLLRAVAELAGERGAAATFDFLYERYLDAHSRRVVTLPADVADLMTELSAAGGGTVFDPLCGLGTLLLSAAASGVTGLIGQERDEQAARIAAVRLLLHGHGSTVRVGDALRDDRFASLQADAVVCCPPFAERAWGYEELAGDIRWQYGLPPRGEPELPWVQHALFHVRPGGHAVVLMPSAAADRRSGRRIRAQLLRAGALRAVVALPAGAAPNSLGSPHLWILRRPEVGDPIPSHVLMVDASEMPWHQVRETVLTRWRSYPADTEGAVPLIDLLDEEVDLTPARHSAGRSVDRAGQEFVASLDAMAASVTALHQALEDLRTFTAERDDLPKTTIAEQVRAGAIVIRQASQQKVKSGEVPMLTVEDVIAGDAPSGRISATAETVALEPGDVVVPSGGRVSVARVIRESGAVLGSGLHLFRVDPGRIDPDCLAGFLRSAGTSRRGQTGTSRSDIRRVEIPRLPLDEQRRLGDAFRKLEAMEGAVGQVADQGAALVALGRAGLGDGTLRNPLP